MRQSRLFHEWEPRVLNYLQSGLKAVEWCTINGLSIHKLRYWIAKVDEVSESGKSPLAKTGDQSVGFGWAAVEIVDSNTNSGIAICIGAARIEVTSGFDKSRLKGVKGDGALKAPIKTGGM